MTPLNYGVRVKFFNLEIVSFSGTDILAEFFSPEKRNNFDFDIMYNVYISRGTFSFTYLLHI